MPLEDFEKDTAGSQKERYYEKRKEKDRHRDHGQEVTRHHHHHHHRHRSSRHRDSHGEKEDRHRSKRSRHSATNGDDDDEHPHKRSHRRERKDETEPSYQPPVIIQGEGAQLKRDSWMEAPSALDVDYVQRRRQKTQESPKPRMLQADFELKLHEKELNRHLHDIEIDQPDDSVVSQPAQHKIDYRFGDSGSQWRMMKLRAVYRQAEESGRTAEDVAMERFGDLRSFDDAREEEIELDRRERYGKDYVGKEQPTGELFKERQLDLGLKQANEEITVDGGESGPLREGQQMKIEPAIPRSKPLDSTALNRLKAQMMKAKLKGSPNAAELEAQYNGAMASSGTLQETDVVVLGVMENRLLAGGQRAEVKPVESRRGRERGQLEGNEDMTVEDMVREERRTRGQIGGEGRRFAERIAKDAKFTNNLEYMDENASKLAKRVQKSEASLKNAAIGEFQKVNRILDACPLCHHEDTGTPPVAPVVSLATRVYLTLPTEPELSEGSTCIVPIQHRNNLLECDDDEWEEIRNFMKCLTRMYHDQGRDVIFYENAAHPHRRRHAAMEAVPLPYNLGQTSPAFFKEAILAADEEWTQHKKVIDTLAKARQGLGKLAFRRTLVKEMPYFHVWFELDGGLGHVVEDSRRWPRGDLFAREVIGGMLDLEPDAIQRQGRWSKSRDRRIDGFQKRWRKFDWTRILMEGN